MIPVADAIKIVLKETTALPAESVALEVARGRILAEDVIADSDLPPFDRSQMDGYAIRAADVANVPAKLKIVGESAAGRGWHEELHAGQAVRIMTGAPVPAGADSVQQVELTREVSNGEEVEIQQTVTTGRSIVRRGSEIKANELVAPSGARINGAMIAVLASFGYASVKVSRQPSVAVLATGSELVRVDQKPGPDQIRDSNNFTISAYAQMAGAIVQQLPLAGDDRDSLERQITESAKHSDIVITSGGVSVGAYDFTKPALRNMGAQFFFERVALRPGKPTVFARLPNGTLFFGLPGNPVSVSVTFNLFARASILAMQSASDTALSEEWARLTRGVKGASERDSYLPALLQTDENGTLSATPLKWGGSSDFIGFVSATALIVIPGNTGELDAGTIVKVVQLPQG
jgi:molybdenum cofactor synthesis domain-containing protein